MALSEMQDCIRRAREATPTEEETKGCEVVGSDASGKGEADREDGSSEEGESDGEEVPVAMEMVAVVTKSSGDKGDERDSNSSENEEDGKQ